MSHLEGGWLVFLRDKLRTVTMSRLDSANRSALRWTRLNIRAASNAVAQLSDLRLRSGNSSDQASLRTLRPSLRMHFIACATSSTPWRVFRLQKQQIPYTMSSKPLRHFCSLSESGADRVLARLLSQGTLLPSLRIELWQVHQKDDEAGLEELHD